MSDLDFQRHMGNTAFTALLANARYAFLTEQVRPAVGFEPIIALVRLEVDFKGQVHYPATLTTETRLDRVGRSSLALAQRMLVGTRLVATSRAVFVLTDRSSGEATPWPEEIRALATTSEREASHP
ncbi:acyl-CoA thioesterase [Streptomyces hirsutus]|uniref:acyl-CoA thioesterase n=1 Tax=Streptomyces hirsutus TaxID=35620 RepID=UPI0012FF167D|nr:thioesterase family protein [Streptomyces hirsutus]